MKQPSRIWLGLKALRELGPTQVGLYGLYQLGLYTGHYQRELSASLSRLKVLELGPDLDLHPCLPSFPEPDALLKILGDQIHELYRQADEIVAGKVRLFGGEPVPLVLSLTNPLEYWTKYESGHDFVEGQDIKYIWEAGRFGWACTLAMAYHLSKNGAYNQAFWQYTDQFFTSNPPFLGPHWSSAQEVAIRIVALGFAQQVFAHPGLAEQERIESLAKTIAYHAERIPPTLVYARSQNNNHLILEALGLYTASRLLPKHPLASRWHKLGWHWLTYSYQTQIDPDGTYTQHSSNYHRLMLQAALWAFAIYPQSSILEHIPPDVLGRLQSSIRWISGILDPDTGHVPNLGHNDGAYILPLTVCSYHDYRPVIHAAARLFLQTNLLPEGSWNDMGLWLGISQQPAKKHEAISVWHERQAEHGVPSQPPYVLVNPVNNSWAVLRAARFHSRPAHADQLHLDLWWHGLNLASDPGTYRYNAASPWENSLTNALVHNTITIDGKEFMHRAGRFLYLDWAQAEVRRSEYDPDRKSHRLVASHSGYRKMGITHIRTLTTDVDGHWQVEDHLDGSPDKPHAIRVHWLLPDWEYEILQAPEQTQFPWYRIRIRSPYGWVSLNLGEPSPQGRTQPQTTQLQIIRAGKLLYGTGESNPISGWISPTYGEKIPALACILEVSQSLPVDLTSVWILPSEG